MTIKQTYQLQLGDTLSRVAAAHHVSLADLLAANQQITHPDTVQVGQVINIAGPAATPPAIPSAYSAYDGIHPAHDTISTNRGSLVTPSLTSTAANRSPALYNTIIDQFAVGHNPRYLPGGGGYLLQRFCVGCNASARLPHTALGAG